uniref:Movement protein TGBp3 n=1 Tax=Chrysanthemum virus B TaxID=12165 RepID=TGB3_CVB|nr:RecName: Full=Movement protein TGBp3; AltName: Full=7 kDa protein; AltName: Full=Triple gene block 3 protein; Short=TGBp3 [Chrysanthemum virus B]AAB20079.1 ORF4 [Chrysanthemum virus B]
MSLSYLDLLLAFGCVLAVSVIVNCFLVSHNNCVIEITGEAVRISGCTFDRTFVELVKGLKPARH